MAILFLALTMISGTLLTGARLDLTEDKLYTLSPGTVNLLRSIEEPITVSFYFSEEVSRELPMVRNFARRVQELLEEMAQRSGGQLRVERVDPRPFSEEEDMAARYGLEGIPIGRGEESLYLGLVGTNLLDGLEVLPFISPAREAFLEYELARMIYSLSRPTPPRVGLLSGLPIEGGMDQQTGQQREPWVIHDQIDQLFDVERISISASSLPDSLDALVLIHPQNLPEELLLAIDQFVLGGGRLLAFLDPWSESGPGISGADPMAAFDADQQSDLEPLLSAWGIGLSEGQFVADLGQALQVTLEQGRPPVRHPGIIGVSRDFMNRDDVTTGDLDAVNLSSPGSLSLEEGSGLEMQALLRSSAQAGLLDSERLRFLSDPGELIDELGPTGQHYVFAARYAGQVATAFPDLAELQHGELNAILVADTDLLADRFWVQRQRFLGNVMVDAFASNGDFVINAIDNLLGNADLISVRSRGVSTRPFQLVDSLRREAERDLRTTEQRLEAELAETEQRLTELQQARGDADLAVLTAEQEAEIDRFINQRLEIRQRLRQVRRDLDRDIEALGTRVKAINIGLMPVLVTIFALWLAWRRRRRATAIRSEARS